MKIQGRHRNIEAVHYNCALETCAIKIKLDWIANDCESEFMSTAEQGKLLSHTHRKKYQITFKFQEYILYH